LSTAVAEAPAVTSRLIRHEMDRGLLVAMKADVNEQALIDEYFEYRDTYGRPGLLNAATIHMLVVHQNRRKAKSAKKDK
jgi:hypothetical protein